MADIPIRPIFRVVPQSQADWDRFFRSILVAPSNDTVGTAELQDAAVTDDNLRDSVALSVIGRSAATDGTPGDIQATTNGTFLSRKLNVLGFFALEDADIPSEIARDSEVTAAIAAAGLTYYPAALGHAGI